MDTERHRSSLCEENRRDHHVSVERKHSDKPHLPPAGTYRKSSSSKRKMCSAACGSPRKHTPADGSLCNSPHIHQRASNDRAKGYSEHGSEVVSLRSRGNHQTSGENAQKNDEVVPTPDHAALACGVHCPVAWWVMVVVRLARHGVPFVHVHCVALGCVTVPGLQTHPPGGTVGALRVQTGGTVGAPHTWNRVCSTMWSALCRY